MLEDKENFLIKQFGDLDFEIHGTQEDPLFKAADIGRLLGINQIRKTIQNLDSEYKVLRAGDTIKGIQDQWFLTEQGLYKVLFISRKNIAIEFQKWVFNVVKEIRSTGKFELEEKLKVKDLLLQNSESEKEFILEKTLLSQFPINTQCVYYGCIDNKSSKSESLVKFGQSNNLSERISAHKKTYTNFKLLGAFKVSNKIHIENAVKACPILKKRIRFIMVEGINYRETLALNDDNFTITKIHEHIQKIVEDNEYNIEKFNVMCERNNALELQSNKLVKENTELTKENQDLKEKLDGFLPKITKEEKRLQRKTMINKCDIGFLMFIFQCKENRFKINICRHSEFAKREEMYKSSDKDGFMKYKVCIMHPFLDKLLNYMARDTLVSLGNDCYDGSYDDLKELMDSVYKLDTILVNNTGDFTNLNSVFDLKEILQPKFIDPELTIIKKAKRAIDQINVDTGEVIATYECIEDCGKALGLTTGTAVGSALRNKKLCKGFIWRYSGVSPEDQFTSQGVIKICCSTGERTEFESIGAAAKDSGVSTPAVRNRIITNVHVRINELDYHWIFNKNSTHYN